MKSKMFKKLMAVSLATVMSVGVMACGGEKAPEATATPAPNTGDTTGGDTTGEDVSTTTVLIDPATGAPYDLGGMEIIVRDWWSDPEAVPMNDYEEAKEEYIDWLEETYHFTIKAMPISSWETCGQDLVDYVTTGGDDVNYVFTMHNDKGQVTPAMQQGLLYDLSTLDCLDFSQEKFQANKVHEMYSSGDSIYCMLAGQSEPRAGIYFNKRLLEEAGVDADTLYDMQKNGEWTWDAWLNIMSQVQRDINSDGVIDVAGFDTNISDTVLQAIYSNGGEIVGMEDGKFVYKLDDAATVEALEWYVETLKTYALVRPEGASWDYYKQGFMNGEFVFMPEEAYVGNANGWLLADGMSDEVGYVMFPKGPNADTTINCWRNNLMGIPACYDADRAWKIAFAWNLYTDPVPGFENYNDLSTYENGVFDQRAVAETIPMMQQPEHGMVTYHTLVPDMNVNEPFKYQIGTWTVVSTLLEEVRGSYNANIEAANQ